MEDIKHVNLFTDDTSGILIDPVKTIFVSGAGISFDPPSSLPTGDKLTNLYIDNMLGKYAAEFKRFWFENFPRIAESVHRDGTWNSPEDPDNPWSRATPRLEFIIGEMDKMDRCLNPSFFVNPDNKKRFGRKSSLMILKEFQIAEPNSTHLKLAQFLKSGSEMITANFDVCLEKAAGMDIDAVTEDQHNMKAVHDSGMTIYHYHGVSTDPDLRNKLGATLKEISRKLPVDFTNWLVECFEKGYDIVFVGYGAVDVFDIKPFFESISDKNYPGRAYYVKHCENEGDAKTAKDELDKHYLYLLAPFSNSTICYGKTSEFLDVLFNNTGIKCQTFVLSSKKETTSEALDNAFENLISDYDDKDKEAYYLINLFRLCAQLTIRPDHIFKSEPWIESVKTIVNAWLTDGDDTVSRIARSNGFTVNSIIGDIYGNNWGSKKYSESGIQKLVRSYMDSFNVDGETELTPYLNWKKGPAPKKLIEEKVHLTTIILRDRLEDKKSRIEQQYTVYYLCGDQTKLLYKLWKVWIIRPLINRRLRFILRMVKKLLDYPPTAFNYRTSYITLCRVRNMIMAMTRKRRDLDIHPVTLTYGDIYHEWDVCMEVPDLADAEKVIKNRIEQYKVRKRRHLPVRKDLEMQLKDIQKELQFWFGKGK